MLHLNYRGYGHAGHPVIILHGMLGMLDNWQTQSRKLADAGFKVYALDQRNHGKSPHSDNFNYVALAQDVDDFMKQHHILSAHIVGHSMGGKVAMHYALTFPHRVDKLVVVDVAPRKYASAHDHILDAMCSLNLRQLATRQRADQEIATRIPELHIRQFLLKNLTRTESGTLKWKVNLSIIRKHYREIANDVTAAGTFDNPTLFIKGALSRYIVDSDKPRIRHLFPHSVIVTIKGTGHWVHAERGEEFGSVLVEFLRS